jgi:hypothetical protein
MRFTVSLVCLALVEGCSATQRPGDTQTAAAPHGERACRVTRAKSESPECFAVRCAEDFVRRNGYTLDPTTGPVVKESVYSPTLEERRGMLARSAIGYRPYPPGHLVVFKYSSSTGKTARAVTMSGEFDDLRVEHQEFLLSAAGASPTCAPEVPANMAL